MKNILKSLFQIFFPLIMGTIIGIVTSNFTDYSNLVRPPLSPPDILFPIIWSILYLLIGISYFLYQKVDQGQNSEDRLLYYVQLFFNFAWTFVFFVFKFRLLSVFWIIVLDILVINMIIRFSKVNKMAAYLLIPYLVWITFATYLTIGIYILN